MRVGHGWMNAQGVIGREILEPGDVPTEIKKL